jgi:hypothetical protein
VSQLPQTFDAAQAGAYSGATPRQLRYWDQVGLVRPSIQSTHGRPGVPRKYSRADVVLLRAVVDLIEGGGYDERGLLHPVLNREGQPVGPLSVQRIRRAEFADILAFHAEKLMGEETWTRDRDEYVRIVTAGRRVA